MFDVFLLFFLFGLTFKIIVIFINRFGLWMSVGPTVVLEVVVMVKSLDMNYVLSYFLLLFVLLSLQKKNLRFVFLSRIF